jgi:hypothetical protein
VTVKVGLIDGLKAVVCDHVRLVDGDDFSKPPRSRAKLFLRQHRPDRDPERSRAGRQVDSCPPGADRRAGVLGADRYGTAQAVHRFPFSQPPRFDRLRRVPLLDLDAREALGWPAKEARGGRELVCWDEINRLQEKLARALPQVSPDGRWRIIHIWQSPALPQRPWSCAICGGPARLLGASAVAWQGGRGKGMPGLMKNGMMCELCLERSEPAMLAFLRALEAPLVPTSWRMLSPRYEIVLRQLSGTTST